MKATPGKGSDRKRPMLYDFQSPSNKTEHAQGTETEFIKRDVSGDRLRLLGSSPQN